ncbi:hypothetical protein STENM327S_06160 [Streptomyces tendae]
MARRLGFDVVSVRADELDQYAAGAALLSALQSSNGSNRAAAAATDDQRLWLLDSITDALEDRARRPVAVVVDDAQWADPATLFVLRTLPGRLAASPVLWVLAVRSDTERPIVARVREDLERLGARWMTLGPLPQQDLQCIAADVLGASPSPALARLLRSVAGNPFLAIELVRAFADTDTVKMEAGGEPATQRHPQQFPAEYRRASGPAPGRCRAPTPDRVGPRPRVRPQHGRSNARQARRQPSVRRRGRPKRRPDFRRRPATRFPSRPHTAGRPREPASGCTDRSPLGGGRQPAPSGRDRARLPGTSSSRAARSTTMP